MKEKYYEIISAETSFELAEKIAQYCETGWYPQGGVYATCYSNSISKFYQAITKGVFNFGAAQGIAKSSAQQTVARQEQPEQINNSIPSILDPNGETN